MDEMGAELVRLPTSTNYIYEQIQMFLRKKSIKSERTSISYEKGIRDFFKIVRPGTTLETLTREDIQLTLDDYDRYILESLDTEKFANSTINQKVQAVRSLMNYLHAKKLDGKSIVEDISYTSQIEILPENGDGWDVLTIDEVLKMAELARTTESHKKDIKYYFILFALDTCLRKSAILRLKWSDFEVKDTYVLVKAIDKGNKEFRPKISKEFYEQILTLKKFGNDKPFQISLDAINDTMKRLRSQMDFGERRIVFHSIRKAGITFHYRVTSDPLSTMKAANHSDFNTTVKYLDDNEYGAIGAVSSSNTLDMELFKSVPHEVLVKIIDEKMKKDFKIILNMALNEEIKKNL